MKRKPVASKSRSARPGKTPRVKTFLTEHFLLHNDVARDISDPESGVSVWKRLQLSRIQHAKKDEDRKELLDNHDFHLGRDTRHSAKEFALFIDDKQVNTGPPPSYEKIKKAIAKKVAKL
jgi:hypothetical protein